ncbi:hypothetical protein J1N35_034914 [Gossypium stocksii]|uniref:Uncharacterized protein n=1 Tax=Gossypium stocksii TaxID=47602 RepID=A0A9D3UTR8_9ROSI|nr:hypothetical protein J1N35_034914 [Gossypium stocksii]
MAKVTTGFEHVTTMSKFKRCKVSVIRDFLPGYRRGATTDFGLNRQIAIDQGKYSCPSKERLEEEHAREEEEEPYHDLHQHLHLHELVVGHS